MLLTLEDGTDLRLDDLGRIEVGQPGRLLEDLSHGEEGDAVAVCEASPP